MLHWTEGNWPAKFGGIPERRFPMASVAAISDTAGVLPKVRLGRTSMHITRVGFGAWAIGGPDWAVGWGPQDDKQSIAAIRHAVERGINWLDTAAAYGLGHSEDVVRRALLSLPASERPYVFTKCGLVWDERNPHAAPRRVGAAASLRREVEASLQRLGVERIDLYQMHWPAQDGTPLAEYWQTLLDLKKEGKVVARSACRTIALHNSRKQKQSATSMRCSRRSPRFVAMQQSASCRGAVRMKPA